MALIGPGTLVVAPWLLWKLSFYGDILPHLLRESRARLLASRVPPLNRLRT
ncbi:MAG: hypothetical protein H6732_14240 [Alphaproteobacteria bacterium]|nr:hypothetical protein [Alphaproteobacteria bacterium]